MGGGGSQVGVNNGVRSGIGANNFYLTPSNLPTKGVSGQSVIVRSTGTFWIWNGSAWQDTGIFYNSVTNPDGSDIGGPLDGYVTANYDTSTSTYYFGKIKSDGSWIIEKLVGGASTFCKGASNYSTNWTNRASLTYVLYSELE